MNMNDNRQRKISLIDVAKQAGVSRSTVSRVVNNDEYVSDDTRRVVQAAIKELGYVPNVAARSLRTQRTQVIAVVMPDPLSHIFSTDNPHYYSALIQAISQVSQAQDYAMLLWVGPLDGEREQYYENILKKRIMDGLIIAASVEDEFFFVDELLSLQMPFVVIGRPMTHADQVSYVSIDNVQAAEQGVDFLVRQGYRRIAKIAGNWNNADSRERVEGYKHALQQHGLPVNPDLIKIDTFSRQAGYRQMHALLAEGRDIDAVFAGSDIIALGALDALNEVGLKVPHDIALLGFDDIPDAAKIEPPLTTIRQSITGKAERATQLLLNMIEGRVAAPKRVLLPTELVQRAST